jgi:hypothetical protein
MARTFDTWGDIGESHYTQVINELIDILLPLLPDSDRGVLLYAYRREIGYRAQRTTEQARISLTEFTEGRRNAQGVPIDFGAGYARSVCQESVARLVAAGLLRIVGRDAGGRKVAGAPSGNTYCFVRAVAQWNLSPYWARWSWGVLGRYVLAASHGLLPGPRTAAESHLLYDALVAKATPERQPITLPQVWPITQAITHGQLTFGGPTVPEIGTVATGELTVPEIGPVGQLAVPEIGPVEGLTVPEIISVMTPQASGANGIGGGKETYVVKETYEEKENDRATRRSAPPARSADATNEGDGGTTKTAKAGKGGDEHPEITAWVKSFLHEVYTAKGLTVPPNIRAGGITALRAMARVYPVAAAVACHGEMVRKQKSRGQMVIVTERMVSDAMPHFYPGWQRANVNGGGHGEPAGADAGEFDDYERFAEQYVASGRDDPNSPNWYGHEVEGR